MIVNDFHLFSNILHSHFKFIFSISIIWRRNFRENHQRAVWDDQEYFEINLQMVFGVRIAVLKTTFHLLPLQTQNSTQQFV